MSKNWKETLVGFIVGSFWFLIIPYFIVLGYIDRVIQSRKYKIEELPKWIHWGNLIIRGSRLFLIIIAYTFIPIILMIIGGRQPMTTNLAPSQIPILPIVGGILYVIVSFFIPGAIAIYTENENSLIGAFKLWDIIKLMLTFPKEYLRDYFIWIGLNILSFFVFIIPFIGFAIFGGINFLFNMICFVEFAEIGGKKVEESKGFQTEAWY